MSGNSEFLAEWIADALKAKSTQAEVDHADALTLDRLGGLSDVIFVIPTWGSGEVPAPAEPLYMAMQAATPTVPPALSHLRYAMVAPGDTTYPDFCGGAKRFDEAVARHGARRLGTILMLDGIPMEKHLDRLERWLNDVVQSRLLAQV
jgi:sulfite reductase (NADPH) flavoprotein alpha-component